MGVLGIDVLTASLSESPCRSIGAPTLGVVPLRPVADTHLSNNDRLREPVSPVLVSTSKLPGTLENSAKSSREGPCERLAGTAKINFGLGLGLDDVGNDGYV
jgi:hypothetical protein